MDSKPLLFHAQVRVQPSTPFVKALVRWATGKRLRGHAGLITSRDVNEAWRPHTCSRPCVFEEKKKIEKKKHEKVHPTQNTLRNSQPPGDRDQLETARGETRPTR